VWILRNKLLICCIKVGVIAPATAANEDLGAYTVVFLELAQKARLHSAHKPAGPAANYYCIKMGLFC
jgi:hypothetical protein